MGSSAGQCAACAVRGLTLCAALETDELSRLNQIVRHQRLGPHAVLFSEADEADAVFNVTAGLVKLFKVMPDGRRQVTGFLFAGDFLGLAMQDRYAYTAETVVTTDVCRFPRRKMDALLKEFPKLQDRLFGMASNELAAAQDQMLLLGRKTAHEKVSSFLLDISRRARRRGQKDNPILVAMSRSDIADYLGLTTETVSRTFTRLKSDGLIRLLAGGKVELIDREALDDMAEGG
ncbi:MAG: helix-turn-helix domain-containing protein [Inquilinaceae bacterium]